MRQLGGQPFGDALAVGGSVAGTDQGRRGQGQRRRIAELARSLSG